MPCEIAPSFRRTAPVLAVLLWPLACSAAAYAQTAPSEGSQTAPSEELYACLAKTAVDNWETAKSKARNEPSAVAQANDEQANPVSSASLEEVLAYNTEVQKVKVSCLKTEAGAEVTEKKKDLLLTQGGEFFDRVEIFQSIGTAVPLTDLIEVKTVSSTQVDVTYRCPKQGDPRYVAAEFAYEVVVNSSKVTFSPTKGTVEVWARSCSVSTQ